MGPLQQLISGRGFDRFQGGLTSRFRNAGLKYVLTYCGPSDNTAMRLDFESPVQMGRVTVWESGAFDAEVLDRASGQVLFTQHEQLKGEAEFHDALPAIFLFMRDAIDKARSEAAITPLLK